MGPSQFTPESAVATAALHPHTGDGRIPEAYLPDISRAVCKVPVGAGRKTAAVAAGGHLPRPALASPTCATHQESQLMRIDLASASKQTRHA